MDIAERCYSVLLVSSPTKFCEFMLGLLPQNRYNPITTAPDATTARRYLLENRFDIVIVNTPLPDEFGTRLALDISEDSGAGVLLFVKAEHYPDICARVAPCGILTISKPASSQIVLQTLFLLSGTRERLRRMEQKTASLEAKMEEIRIVNRAKWLLIDKLKMTEAEAHRHIEKQAMDRCVTRRVIAEEILETYKQ
ncbi:MAG: ANTAR domain-containing response regulator [Eubacteriales bacterium]